MRTMMRAAIMLAALVGLPAVWVYYGPLPPPAQRVVDRVVTAAQEAVEWERWTGTRPPSSEHPSTRAVAAPSAGSPQAPRRMDSVVPAPSLSDRVEPSLSQLRTWGAKQYQLEPWGAGSGWFRFSCEMPLAPGTAATQEFQAVTADPQAAVEQVVAEVALWRTAPLTAMR